MNDPASPISVFKNYFETTPAYSTSIAQFCTIVKDCAYIDDVNLVRNAPDPMIKKELKAKLPAYTISGTFTERNSRMLLNHSGYICIDVDGKDNPHVTSWSTVRNKLGSIEEVMLSSLSVSGNGVFLVIPLAHPEHHAEQFKALYEDFKVLGYTIDKACSDICRLRVVSADPDAIYDPEAIPYQRVYKKTEKAIPRVSMYSLDKKWQNVEECVAFIEANHIDIAPDYETYVAVSFALASEFKEAGRGLFHRACSQSGKYNHQEADEQYTATLRSGKSGITIGTFFHLCKKHGITYSKSKTTSRWQSNTSWTTPPGSADIKPRSKGTDTGGQVVDKDQAEDKPTFHSKSGPGHHEPQRVVTSIQNIQTSGWNIDSLKNFFSRVSLPDIIQLDCCTKVADVPLFIETHLATCEGQNGNPTYFPYYSRLLQAKRIIASLQ
jgi:hypothetical protein